MSHEFHSLKVVDIKRETTDASTLYFEIPQELSTQYEYKSGQYLTLKFTLNGQEVRRPYSICTSPNESKFGVNVKRVKKGLVSNHVNDQVNVGDLIDVMQPDGTFTMNFDHSLERELFFFSSGSGITPIISLIKTALEEEPKSRCYLLYGNKSEDSIIFKKELEELEQKYSGQFYLRHTLTQPKKSKSGGLKGLFSKGKESWTGWKGRVDGKRVDLFLDEHKNEGKETHFFICGPGAMIDTLSDHLEKKSIALDRIHTERFTAASAPNITNVKNGEASRVKVQLSGKEIEISVTPDKTILDTLIDEKYDPPYSCTSGACSTCIAKLTKGSVEMDACYALDDDEIKEGYILVCQSRATTPEVEITFDT